MYKNAILHRRYEREMLKLFRCFFVFWMLLVFSLTHFAQDKPPDENKNQEPAGLEIVFVVDVSYSMKDHLTNVSNFIKKVYEAFSNDSKNEDSETGGSTPKNNFHLITFSDFATYHGTLSDAEAVGEKINDEKDITLEEIKRKKNDNRKNREPKKPYTRQNTYPKHGLWEVFTLIEINFIQKRGIVLFFSDGEDSRSFSNNFEEDFKTPINSLKNIGFSVLSVFVNTGNEKYMCKKRMKQIADFLNTADFYTLGNKTDIDFEVFRKEVMAVGYNSPRLRNDYLADKMEWETSVGVQKELVKEAENAKEKALKKILELEGELMVSQLKSRTRKILNDILNMEINNYRSKFKLWHCISIVLLFLIIPTGGYLGYRWHKKKMREQTEDNPLNMLWGKLIPPDKELAPINLGDKAPGFEVSPPKGLPVLKFFSHNHKGKKAIKLHYNEKDGHLKFYYKKENKEKRAWSRHYIDNSIVSFRVAKPENEGIYCKYEYEFLDKFSKSCAQPVWKADEFKGRDDIVREIKNNFLDETNSHNYFISGMGNAGKTSLIKHLYHVAMGRDEIIKLKYAMAFIEFKKESYRSFLTLENEILEKLGPVEKGRRKLIFIDEYDEIFNEFPNEFGGFLKEYDFHKGYYYVFAGRIGKNLLKELGLLDTFPHYRKFVNLGSLDNVGSISSSSYEMSVSFLNDQLSEIGFPQAALNNEAKRSIVTHASGFPSLIKEILLRLLISWSADYDMHLIDVEHVDNIVLKIKDSIRDFLFKRIYAIDEKNHQGINAVPAKEVRFREIFNRLLGDLKGESNIKEIVRQLSQYPNDHEIEKEREKSVDKKIKQLKEMGFVDVVEGKLIKLPSMVFYGEVK